MLNKELIRTILGKGEDYYTKKYLENDFPQEYKLIERIESLLTDKEFELLFKMLDENGEELYKLVRYFSNNK